MQRNVLILGAAGRDFHTFNTVFRRDPSVRVVGFTATQIPGISGRRYPASLAGPLYPDGIPVFAETDLQHLIKTLKVDACVFAYSDIAYNQVMHLAAVANSEGSDFELLSPLKSMLRSSKPVISVVATRTGTGKSQTCRAIATKLSARGWRPVIIRHPMPYGDLAAQAVQRFVSTDDLASHDCTLEEREEYEPHLANGHVVYAGVDYEAILRDAECDPDGCDVILWDGGNNDAPFLHSDLVITVTDPQRGADALDHYAGEINLRLADVVLINKIDSARPDALALTEQIIKETHPDALIIRAESKISVDNPQLIRGKTIVVVEDGPSLTHGNLPFGAGLLAAQQFGAGRIVDPRNHAIGSLAECFKQWPRLGPVLPAMGYSPVQRRDLKASIEACEADTVVVGTPIDLAGILGLDLPSVRVRYELFEVGHPNLDSLLDDFLQNATD